MGIIYKIENSVNDKIYVGQTTRTISIRWKEHLRDYKIKDTRLYRAMRKYGTEAFRISEIEKCLNKTLNEREMYWISELDSYHNGYNSTYGGDGVHMDRYIHKFIPVVQYDKEGNKIAEFESAMQAEEITGISRTAICCVCKGIYLSVRGFQWRYKNDAQEHLIPVNTNTRNEPKCAVVQFGLDGKKINEYESIRSACKIVSGGTTRLRACLSGSAKTAFGYQWKKKSEVGEAKEISPTKYTGKGGRPPRAIYFDEAKGVS